MHQMSLSETEVWRRWDLCKKTPRQKEALGGVALPRQQRAERGLRFLALSREQSVLQRSHMLSLGREGGDGGTDLPGSCVCVCLSS